MSCDNLIIPKPLTGGCLTNLFGIPYQAAGRTVGGTTFPIAGIVLHCYDGTIAELCNEMKCRTRSSVISGSWENSFHYGIGAASSSGNILQFVEDGNISWTFGTYKNNTYATVPPPNIAINWPTLQGLYGINTTPDVYTINIALAIGHIVQATQSGGCYECPTASGLQQTQHDQLVQLLAYLVQEHNITLDAEHITFHDLIHCGEGEECPCTDIETLLAEVAAFCPPCEEEAPSVPIAEVDDNIEYILGITEPCCPSSPGCLNKIPWNACFIGDLAVDGTLDSYILGLAQDPVTMQWCLTRGCLAVTAPLIGCGTVDDPLRIDPCLMGAWLPDEPVTNVVNLVAIDAQGCAIEVPACELVVECETEITVVDTNCIDLTASGVNNHTLQADIIISPDAGNQIECRANGLFGIFDCDEFQELFQTVGVVDWVSGVDTENACVRESIADIFDRLFSVADTNCIDLDFTGNVLTATPIIDPAGNNILTCGQAGLLVPEFVVADSDCIDLTMSNNELSASVIISPQSGNLIECLGDGLFVNFTTSNTDCIAVSFVGGVLSVSPIISPSVGGVLNALDCLATGMYVPRGANTLVNGPLTGNGSDTNPIDIDFGLMTAQDLCDFGGNIPSGTLVDLIGRDGAECLRRQTVADVIAAGLIANNTDCIDLTLLGNTLTADPIISPTAGNQLTCTATGLYVGPNQVTVVDTDCLNLNLVGNVLSGTITLAGTQGGVPNIVSCIAGQGLYVPEGGGLTVLDTTCINLDLTSGVLQASVIVDPTGDNQVQCLPAGLYVPPTAGLLVNDTNCISLNLAGDTLTASPIIAPAQSGVSNALSCIPGQGLYVPTSVAGTNIFSISDDQANSQVIVGGDTIFFEGINGATQRVSGVDTVTIDGHMICAAGPPTTIPPYDIDQAWTHYDPNSGTNYNWNCATNKWETCAFVFDGTAPPDATTCSTNTIINGVTEGVWCPGVSTYRIPAGFGQANIGRRYLLTEDCRWCKICDDGESNVFSNTRVNGLAEATTHFITFNNTGVDDWGLSTLPSMTVEERGCYEVTGQALLEYNVGVDFEASLAQISLYVNGVFRTHLSEVGGFSLNRAVPGAPITMPLRGSTIVCLDASQVLTLGVTFATNVGGQQFDILSGALKVAKS